MLEVLSSEERMNKSDHGGSEKKEKKKMSDSNHGPDRESRGGGLSRSKSDRGFRDSNRQQLQAEEEFSKQLKLSKSKSTESLHDRTIRRGGRKPSDPVGTDGTNLIPKGESSKRKSRSRSLKRRSGAPKENSNSSGQHNATFNLPLPTPETPKESKGRSRSKKRESRSSSSVSSDGSSIPGDSIRSADSNSNSSGRKSVLKRVSSSRKSSSKKNSATLGLEETPIRSKKFTESKRGNLVEELFSSDPRPFQASLSLPMEEDESDT
jgi:hypothetical protein